MRTYINEIDPKLIQLVLNDSELEECKQLVKEFQSLKSKKYSMEKELTSRLRGFIIGELEGVEIHYLSVGNTLYVSYTEPVRWYIRIWLKFIKRFT